MSTGSRAEATPDHVFLLLEAVQRRLADELLSDAIGDTGGIGLRRLRLLQLVPTEGARQQHLADAALVSKQAVGELLLGLESAGLIRRDPDPADGRAWLVRRTAAGDRALTDLDSGISRVESGLRARLGEERYAAFVALMREAAEANG